MDEWIDREEDLPNYFSVNDADDLWNRCLASAADYFTEESVEYRLLRHGIALHHGKMPGLLARRLKAVIDRGLVRVAIATSTLSEGVNIPVNYLLTPSVYRANSKISLQEFTNLIGRAGRPGVATEGSALVVLHEKEYRRDRFGRRQEASNRQRSGYQELITELEAATIAAGRGAPEDAASSPLGELLRARENAWKDLTGDDDPDEFERWLEETAVVGDDEPDDEAYGYLDTLDAFLIASIQEIEELHDAEIAPARLEEELIAIWRKTYAFAAARDEERLSAIWLGRGRVIKNHYPDAEQRRRLYKTSLSPRSATMLLDRAEAIRTKLQEGMDYAGWSKDEQLLFIEEVLRLVSEIPVFRIETRLGRHRDFRDWPRLLRWWLAKSTLPNQPGPGEISNWYAFVVQNFIYRGSWGLGSVIGLLLDIDENGQPIRAIEIDDWPRSGLPWIAFWLKELINWGTLDPVAAFLLARGDAIDRPQAEEGAQAYYDSLSDDVQGNDILNPRTIRDWVIARRPQVPPGDVVRYYSIDAVLVRPSKNYRFENIAVTPLARDEDIFWVDPAGYVVAYSEKPENWPDRPSSFNFELAVADSRILGEAYLRHL